MTSPLNLLSSQRAKSPQAARLRRLVSSQRDYAITFGLASFILVLIFRLWRFDFNIPFSYGVDDDLMVQLWSKTIYEFGWYMENPRLGAPLSLHMGDFPMADGLHQMIFKMIGWFTPNYVVALNVFFFLGFPLTAVSALFVYRRFGIGFPAAVAGSLLFTFLPYNYFRNIGHLYLTSYYVVPLSMMVALWIHLGRVAIFAPKLEPGFDRRAMRSRWVGSLIIAGLQGCAGVYYAFFACYLLLISGTASAFQRRKLYPLYTAMVLIAITSGVMLINLTPHLIHRFEHGPNSEIAHRTPDGSERYGLKITNLVLPTPNHRFGPFSKLSEYYAKHAVPWGLNENQWATLGLVGTAGFLFLLLYPLYRRQASHRLIESLSLLNLFCVLLGTVGGLGALFSLLISPMLRGYNRISVSIAFLSFFAVCYLLERFRLYLKLREKSAWVFPGLVALLLVGGLLDEVPANIKPRAPMLNPQFATAERWKNDAEFFKKVEASLPGQAAVFLFPHMNFPEVPPFHEIEGYDHARGYLHTDRLRWSYSMRGRQVDIAIRKLSNQPIEEQLKALATGGFLGICIDRGGYPDHARDLENQLAGLLGTTPLVSNDQTLSFFNMAEYADRLKSSLTMEDWEALKNSIWFSICPAWGAGFYGMETDGASHWRWGQSEARLSIINPTEETKTFHLKFACHTLHPAPSRLSLKGPSFSADLELNQAGTPFSQVLTLPPGRYEIRFATDAQRADLPGEMRNLVFCITNFQLTEVLEAD